jgi:hypothetical protein
MDDNANIYKRLKFISDTTTASPKGITIQFNKLIAKLNTGANKKINLFAVAGIIASLNNNFTPSARGCNNPKNPTILGPFLRCIAPNIFLSANVKNATLIKIGNNIKINSITIDI